MKKSNIIISVLIFVIFILVFCFIYFSGVLVFNKKSDDGLGVSIVNIQSKEQIGGASNESAPVFDKTSATFKSNFATPGDYITYEITIENNGKEDAKLKKIVMGDTNNTAITSEISGVSEGQLLKAGQSHFALVTIKYDENAQKSPESLKSSLTVKLDYVKA